MKTKTVLSIAIAVILLLSGVVAAGFNQPPLAEIKTPVKEIFACGRLVLDGSYSKDLDGEIVSWKWLVGNSEVSGKKLFLDPPFTNTPGYYTITLTVTDNGGASDEETIGINIKPNKEPQILEILLDNKDGVFFVGEKFTLKAVLTTESQDDTVFWQWEYPREVFNFSNSSIANPTVTVISAAADESYYTFKVVVKDTCGQSDTEEIRITVKKNSPPVAEISAPDKVNEAVSFVVDGSLSTTGTGFNEKNDELTYEWWWAKRGNNKTSVISYDQKVTLIFPDGGILVDIWLRVIDKSGVNSTANTSIFVEETEDDKPVADASATGKTAVPGENFTLNGSRSYDDRTYLDGNLSYVWKLSANFAGVSWQDEVYTRKPEYTYKFQRVGTYSVMLTVRDSSFQESSSGTSVNVVSSLTPTLTLTPTPTPIPTPISTPTPTPTPPPLKEAGTNTGTGLIIIIGIIIFLYLILKKVK